MFPEHLLGGTVVKLHDFENFLAGGGRLEAWSLRLGTRDEYKHS